MLSQSQELWERQQTRKYLQKPHPAFKKQKYTLELNWVIWIHILNSDMVVPSTWFY